MDLFDLVAKITLDTKEYERGISAASKSFSGVGNKLKSGLAAVSKASLAAVGVAAAGVSAIVKSSVDAYGEYEQLVGGAQKIFDQMDYSAIAQDASNAWSTMNLSASQYLSMINSVGATFANTMGDEKGYETAKRGMQSIADYASGTGRNVEELNQKFALITRSSQSYQSIADQFSGILPATSKGFLEQAQAAGYLSDSYTQLTEVPIDEYQEAVALMLEKGVADLGLAENTAAETANTITGSLAGMKASWQNLLVAFGSGKDIKTAMDNLLSNAKNVVKNVMPIAKNALTGIATFVKDVGPIIIQELPGLIQELLPELLSAAVSLVGSLIQALPGILSALWETVKTLFSTFMEWLRGQSPELAAVFDGIIEAGKKIIDFFANFQENVSAIWEAIKAAFFAAIEAIKSFFFGLVETASSTLNAIKEGFSDAVDVIKSKIAEWVSAAKSKVAEFKSVGQTVVNNILAGIQGAWNSLVSWVQNAWNSIKSLFRIDSSDVQMPSGGSGHAIGLDYVPTNNYPALLHRGEAVLTAREADEWRRGGMVSAADPNVAAILEVVREIANNGLNANIDSRSLYRSVRTENRTRTRATNYNALAMA